MSWLSRLQLGEGSEEAPGGTVKVKTSAQGNGLDSAPVTQEVMVVSRWGGSEEAVLSIAPCCRAAMPLGKREAESAGKACASPKG